MKYTNKLEQLINEIESDLKKLIAKSTIQSKHRILHNCLDISKYNLQGYGESIDEILFLGELEFVDSKGYYYNIDNFNVNDLVELIDNIL